MQEPSSEEVRSALERMLRGPQFASAPRASRFIRFLVEGALDGRNGTLKEYVLGVEVFDRGPAFDPAADTIVRVEAVKLRKRLAAWYRGPGRREPVVIQVPKGAYRPQFRLRTTRARSAAPSRVQGVAVAVLPFLNLSPGARNEFWSDGLTAELTAVLSRAASLRVVSRTSAFAFKGKAMDVRTIGRLLGVSMVIEGSVRRRKNQVRVSAQLTEAATGVHLWSATLEREIEDAWAVQQEIAQAVVEAVHLELTTGERRRMGKRHTENAEAFELYLKGRHWLDRFDAASQRAALKLFERAGAADPAYPLPLLGIARGHMNLALLGMAAPAALMPRAEAALRDALILDPELAEAHALMASLLCRHGWDWKAAEKHYRVALRLAPNAAEVHDEYATGYLAPLGRIEDALAENRVARELDPFSPQLARSHAFILLLARRLPDAERECRQVLGYDSRDGYARLVLALALHGQRRMPEALAEYERLYAGHPSIQNEAYLADVRALTGDRRPAEDLLRRLTSRAATEFIPAMIFAWLYLHLGRIEEAVSAIEDAFRNREYELLVAKVGYGFDAFREHPRFRAIVRQLGLD